MSAISEQQLRQFRLHSSLHILHEEVPPSLPPVLQSHTSDSDVAEEKSKAQSSDEEEDYATADA